MRELHADVVVAGSGCAGSVAAIAAARGGADTLVIEWGPFLGGISAGVLDTFYAFYTPGDRSEKVVSGIPDEIVTALEREGGAFRRPNSFGAGTGITYDPECLKRVWERFVLESGGRVLLRSFLVDAEVADNRVLAVIIANKAGLVRITADVFVDATGDGDLCARAGADFELAGRDVPGQSLSTTFRLGGVDIDKALSVPKRELNSLMRQAKASQEYDLPREEGSVHRTPHPDVMFCLMTRIPDVDATDPFALSDAEIEGRRQSQEYHRFLRECVPGYERSYIIQSGPYVGVRESRRIRGDYVLTADDVLNAHMPPDAIARCGAPIEDHHAGSGTRWEYIPDSGTYGIPWRSLLPKELEGLIVAGRCLSATHDAHASARSMGTCMAMGQAAGTGAAMAFQSKTVPRQLGIESLQQRLDADGADFGQRAPVYEAAAS